MVKSWARSYNKEHRKTKNTAFKCKGACDVAIIGPFAFLIFM